MDSLREVDLSYNLFTGAIPDGFDLLKLRSVDLRGNPFLVTSPRRIVLLRSCLFAVQTGLCVNISMLHAQVSPTCALPRFYNADFGHLLRNTSEHFACPSIRYNTTFNEIMVDPKYYCHTLCVCDPSFFGANGRCLPCLPHADCR
jgi:hypothetical protein